MTSRRKRRQLTDEETLLWHKVSRTVTPLNKGLVDEPDRNGVETMAQLLGEGDAPKPPEPKSRDIRSPFQAPPRPPVPKPAPRPVMDRPTTRKIEKGRIGIDARIDLHAMTQERAHDSLYAFLADARSRGLRHVLVVTGKGRSAGSEGVLKRMVPVWLNGARFNELVSGYSSAGRKHGGEGAIYVRLRRLSNPDGSLRQ